jgi:Spy/CpxP family protein refolding chaperone
MIRSAFNPVTATRAALVRVVLAVAAVGCLAIPASAQGRGPGGPPGGGTGGFGGGVSVGIGGGNRSPMNGDNRTPVPYSTESQSGLKLGPPGRWWDNKEFARRMGLDSRQQKRMDDVFVGNKDNLLKLYKNLQHEESQLERLTRSRELDENQIFQQIDRVTQARAELEKANAHMLLQIRREMTPEQTSRLNDFLPTPSQ